MKQKKENILLLFFVESHCSQKNYSLRIYSSILFFFLYSKKKNDLETIDHCCRIEEEYFSSSSFQEKKSYLGTVTHCSIIDEEE